MANTTLTRKSKNEMKRSQGLTNPWTHSDQMDTSLDFNGQNNNEKHKPQSLKYSGNQHKQGFKNPDEINFGCDPKALKGAYFGKTAGPATASGRGNPIVEGGRKWSPDAKENFKGNPDKIQDRQVPNRVGNKKD